VLEECLKALESQDYDGEYEVVVVDDRSLDGTWVIIGAWARSWVRLKGVRAAPELRFRCAKKSALAQGIEASSGEILLFTDADCRPPIEWVRSMAAHFGPEVGLVAGYARPAPLSGFAAKLLAVDNLAVGALGAGSFAMGRPLSCTGRNLAYRRRVYEEVGGFERIGHLVAGDDVYFMRLVADRGRWGMIFNRESVVLSQSPPTRLGAIVQQKLRHAAKAGHYRGGALYLAIAVYAFHLFLALGVLRMLLVGGWDSWVLAIWGARWVVDLWFLARMASAEERPLLYYLPWVEVLYIPYVLIFALVGRLGWFRWKT
jgi:cellulose synthase/poly-beta-1,6-N-acetylglucosamine synthase-like glycosyltransferase